MAANEEGPIVVTRGLVKRAWSDFEPKLLTAMITGQAAAVVLNILAAYHVNIDASGQKEITLAFALLAGYLMPSAGTTITKVTKDTRETVSESHTGNITTTVTAGIPIQAGATPAPQPQATQRGTNPSSNPPQPSAQAQSIMAKLGNTASHDTADNAPTTVIPPATENGPRW